MLSPQKTKKSVSSKHSNWSISDHTCCIHLEWLLSVVDAALRLEIPKLKKGGKVLGKEKFLKKARQAAERLEVQGAIASLVAQEKDCIPWQSLIYAVPRGVMAWMVRASTNCLASPDNLEKGCGHQMPSLQHLALHPWPPSQQL